MNGVCVCTDTLIHTHKHMDLDNIHALHAFMYIFKNENSARLSKQQATKGPRQRNKTSSEGN